MGLKLLISLPMFYWQPFLTLNLGGCHSVLFALAGLKKDDAIILKCSSTEKHVVLSNTIQKVKLADWTPTLDVKKSPVCAVNELAMYSSRIELFEIGHVYPCGYRTEMNSESILTCMQNKVVNNNRIATTNYCMCL